jgi:hypothetical protein
MILKIQKSMLEAETTTSSKSRYIIYKLHVSNNNYNLHLFQSLNEKLTVQETPDAAPEEFDMNNPVEFALRNVLVCYIFL